MIMPSIPRHPTDLRYSEQKNLLRKTLLAQRRQISSAQKMQYDQAISQQVFSYIHQHNIRSLGVYLPIHNEPDLINLYKDCHTQHITLALPVVTDNQAPLLFARWTPDMPLTEGAFHTQIPSALEQITPDALLLPCVGFNKARKRLGYGGGFYDRTLSQTPRPTTIGVAYSLAYAEFTAEDHDIALNVIITENTLY